MERFLYRPRLVPTLLAGLFFAGCGAFFVYRARSNDRGLIINHVIELGVAAATMFYGVFAAFSLAFVLAAIVASFQRLGPPRYLVLDEESLRVPKRWRRDVVTVRYADIQGLTWQSISGQDTLILQTTTGKLNIAAIMLESKAVFERVVGLIREKMEGDGDGHDDDDDDSRARAR